MTPAYRMWDPSKAVLFAFAVFFAMIFADAGYGMLLGVILWAMWKRLGAHRQRSWPARRDADAGHLLDCLRRSAGVVLRGGAAGGLVARRRCTFSMPTIKA